VSRQFTGEEILVKKKVRYAVGAVGAVPALGLMIPAAAAASAPHAAKTAKQVRITGPSHAAMADPASSISSSLLNGSLRAICSGHQGNHRSESGMVVRFYSAPYANSKTCIGTIEVSTIDRGSLLRGWVSNHYGAFCMHSGVPLEQEWTCKDPFRRRNLAVVGVLSNAPHSSARRVASLYPFRHNHFN
jgi:hypothetical protein